MVIHRKDLKEALLLLGLFLMFYRTSDEAIRL